MLSIHGPISSAITIYRFKKSTKSHLRSGSGVNVEYFSGIKHFIILNESELSFNTPICGYLKCVGQRDRTPNMDLGLACKYFKCIEQAKFG